MRLLFAVAGVLLACVASARESAPDLRAWFLSLADREDEPCIQMGRPRPVSHDEWRCIDEAGPCAIVIAGEWVPIPDVAIVDEQNRIGPAVVWIGRRSGAPVCFLPGVKA